MAERITAVVTTGGFEIIGNREGLLGLAEICRRLAALPETPEESRRLGNHYHYAPWANTPKTAHSNSPPSISPNFETEPRRIVPA